MKKMLSILSLMFSGCSESFWLLLKLPVTSISSLVSCLEKPSATQRTRVYNATEPKNSGATTAIIIVKGVVYMAQVFASNETLLLWFGPPFMWQWRAGAPETANIWNRVSEWKLLKMGASFHLCEIASGVPVNMVMMLMLMLAQVNAFRCSH